MARDLRSTRRRRSKRPSNWLLVLAMTASIALVAGCSNSGGGAGGGSTSATTSSGTATSSGASISSHVPTGSDPGITSDSVTVGGVVTISGPVPGLFQGDVNGAEAYFAYINSQGGVNGRQINFKVYDDGLNCQTDTSAYQNNLNSIFAFVASYSAVDSCGAKVLAQHPEVPDVSIAFTPEAKQVDSIYDPEPEPIGWIEGPYEYYKSAYPNNMKAGGLYGSASPLAWNAISGILKSLGYNVAYSRGVGQTEANFTSDILRMKNAGVNFLDLTDMAINQVAIAINEANQAGWHPLIETGETAYDSHLPSLLSGDAGTGLLSGGPFTLYQGEDSSVPGVALFNEWMKKTSPSYKPDFYSQYGWSAAGLFVEALKQAGPNPIRASVIDALKGIHDWTANGLTASNDPGDHKPATCWVVARYSGGSNGHWSRVTPASGFQCNPGGYFYLKTSS